MGAIALVGGDEFRQDQEVNGLVQFAQGLDLPGQNQDGGPEERTPVLSRDDLHLVCFDFVWS